MRSPSAPSNSTSPLVGVASPSPALLPLLLPLLLLLVPLMSPPLLLLLPPRLLLPPSGRNGCSDSTVTQSAMASDHACSSTASGGRIVAVTP